MASSEPAMSPVMCHLSIWCLSRTPSHSPSPQCSLWEGPPCGVWERKCSTLSCSQVVSRAPPLLKDPAAAGSEPGRALGAICLSCLPCSFPIGAVVKAGSCHWAIFSRGAHQCQAPFQATPSRASTGAKNNQRRQQPWYLQAPPVPPPCQPAGHRIHLLPDVNHQPWGRWVGSLGGHVWL